MLPSFQVSISVYMGGQDKNPILKAQSSPPYFGKHSEGEKKQGYAKLVTRPLCRLLIFDQLLQDEFDKTRKHKGQIKLSHAERVKLRNIAKSKTRQIRKWPNFPKQIIIPSPLTNTSLGFDEPVH